MGMLIVGIVVWALVIQAVRKYRPVRPPRPFGADIYVMAAVYLTGIIGGQIVLYRGKNPRWASVYGGVVGGGVAVVIGLIWLYNHDSTAGGSLSFVCTAVSAVIVVNLAITPFSYLLGCAVAGAFLVLDRVRTGQWNPSHEQVAVKKSHDPWDQPQLDERES